jgi:hypothetical protein
LPKHDQRRQTDAAQLLDLELHRAARGVAAVDKAVRHHRYVTSDDYESPFVTPNARHSATPSLEMSGDAC